MSPSKRELRFSDETPVKQRIKSGVGQTDTPAKPVSEFSVGRSQAKGMGAGLLKDIKRKMMKHLPGKLKKTY